MRALGFDVKKAEVMKLMQEFDRNDTGQITYQDFVEISTCLALVLPLFFLSSLSLSLSPLYSRQSRERSRIGLLCNFLTLALTSKVVLGSSLMIFISRSPFLFFLQ